MFPFSRAKPLDSAPPAQIHGVFSPITEVPLTENAIVLATRFDATDPAVRPAPKRRGLQAEPGVDGQDTDKIGANLGGMGAERLGLAEDHRQLRKPSSQEDSIRGVGLEVRPAAVNQATRRRTQGHRQGRGYLSKDSDFCQQSHRCSEHPEHRAGGLASPKTYMVFCRHAYQRPFRAGSNVCAQTISLNSITLTESLRIEFLTFPFSISSIAHGRTGEPWPVGITSNSYSRTSSSSTSPLQSSTRCTQNKIPLYLRLQTPQLLPGSLKTRTLTWPTTISLMEK